MKTVIGAVVLLLLSLGMPSTRDLFHSASVKALYAVDQALTFLVASTSS